LRRPKLSTRKFSAWKKKKKKMKEDVFLAAQRFVGAVSVTQILRSHYVKENWKR
jgi:hypothetical protein